MGAAILYIIFKYRFLSFVQINVISPNLTEFSLKSKNIMRYSLNDEHIVAFTK